MKTVFKKYTMLVQCACLKKKMFVRKIYLLPTSSTNSQYSPLFSTFCFFFVLFYRVLSIFVNIAIFLLNMFSWSTAYDVIYVSASVRNMKIIYKFIMVHQKRKRKRKKRVSFNVKTKDMSKHQSNQATVTYRKKLSSSCQRRAFCEN